jgi:Flp pilus assembly protein TadD
MSNPTPVASSTTGSAEGEPIKSVELSRPVDQNDFREDLTDRQRFDVHLEFGRIFEGQGNYDGALLEYQAALTTAEARGNRGLDSQDRALAHRRMGGALDKLGRFAQAEVHYNKALKLSPKDPKVWNDSGYSYYLQGKWEESERALRTAARFAPDDNRIKTNLGLTLAAAGREDEALTLLSESRGDAIGHANLGYILASTGRLDLARKQYERAISLRPDLGLAHQALANIDATLTRTAGRDPQSGGLPLPTQFRPSPSEPGRDEKVAQVSTTRSNVPPPRPAASLLPMPDLPKRSLPE